MERDMKSVILQTFRRSRIFAEGWNSASMHSFESRRDSDNPYLPAQNIRVE
jgi:hypothetical protein